VAANGRLTRAVRQALRALADPAKAPAMQAYMKSELPYRGIQATPLRQALRPLFVAHRLESFEVWRDTVLDLWRAARYREERYAAIELAGHRAYQPFQTLDALPAYEEMIVSGAWWDLVDGIASHQIGGLLRRYPPEMAAILRCWAAGDDIWKRRAAILAQLGFRGGTDCKLLYDCIKPSLGRPEFFLRKGIGWALRQYARADAAEVLRYVRRHEKLLSPLSQREALKGVNRKAPATRPGASSRHRA
jgi:3-methyladenine DNA glycosylase AlkD